MKKTVDVILLDGLAGVVSGLAVLVFSSLILRTHNWTQDFIFVHVTTSLVYGSYSLLLAYRRVRPLEMISILAVANFIWALVCGILAIVWHSKLTFLGQAHLLLEMLLVGHWGYMNGFGVIILQGVTKVNKGELIPLFWVESF